MKKIKITLIAASAMLTAFALQSCLDKNNDYVYIYPNALITVKPIDKNAFYMQLDEKTTMVAANLKGSPYGDKEVRALVNFSDSDSTNTDYDKVVRINWIDSILTKQAIAKADIEDDNALGDDAVEILNDWVTIAEDGYLTLRFSTLRGNICKAHLVNLVTGVNPDDPYEVEFRHNAYGDKYGFERDGLVAFRLANLPDTEGKTVKLKLKWRSFSGIKTAEFPYCTRKATPSAYNLALTDVAIQTE